MVSLVIKRFVSSNVFVWNKSAWPTNILSEATSSCFVRENFITEAEESCLVAELEPHMKRLKYEHDHWDNAIYLYREREQRKWSTENTKVIQRILDVSFPTVDPAKRSPFIHILDLHQDGHIKPHIDSTRYCGTIVTGLSLISDSIMRLRHKDHKDEWIVDLFLPRRSLYKISGITRYDFTHEILSNEESEFQGRNIEKGRRISLVCRDLPTKEENNEPSFKQIE